MTPIPQQPVATTAVGLSALAAALMVVPFRIRAVERNLEIFFLGIGALSVSASGLWTGALVLEALRAPVMIGSVPIGIVQVVLIMGLLIHYTNASFSRWVLRLARHLGHRLFIFLLIAGAGLVSGIVSAIVAAVLIVEILAALPFAPGERKGLTVVSCFSAGFGACLSPLGEPLSTILVSKLAGPPYQADFFFPLKEFGPLLIPAVLALALFGAVKYAPRMSPFARGAHAHDPETPRTVAVRALRIYLFIAALVLIGEGFRPLMVWYLSKLPPPLLFWANISSSLLDNATLTAIEIGPAMALPQIVAVVLGLAISGGMLIPGNLPNIVAAGRMKITMKEWARLGVPLGAALMGVYFTVLYVL